MQMCRNYLWIFAYLILCIDFLQINQKQNFHIAVFWCGDICGQYDLIAGERGCWILLFHVSSCRITFARKCFPSNAYRVYIHSNLVGSFVILVSHQLVPSQGDWGCFGHASHLEGWGQHGWKFWKMQVDAFWIILIPRTCIVHMYAVECAYMFIYVCIYIYIWSKWYEKCNGPLNCHHSQKPVQTWICFCCVTMSSIGIQSVLTGSS